MNKPSCKTHVRAEPMFNKRRFKDNFSGTWSARNKKVHMLLKSVCYKITNARVVQNHKTTKIIKWIRPPMLPSRACIKNEFVFFDVLPRTLMGEFTL